MHDIDSTQGESDQSGLEALEPESFEFNFERNGAFETGSPFSEHEENELAEELLSVQNEYELDQFLGKLVSKAWGGVKKFAKSSAGRALGGVLKGIAKKALPVVGGALGSMIPIPGVGTMIGRAAGTAVSNLFELELEGMDSEEQEFEVAKRFVRLAGASANRVAAAPKTAHPKAVAQRAVMGAARDLTQDVTSAPYGRSNSTSGFGYAPGGRWIRRGRKIVILGV